MPDILLRDSGITIGDLADVIVDTVMNEVDVLRKRINALENSGQPKYVGVHQLSAEYKVGHIVRRPDGVLWFCNQDTQGTTPGISSHWVPLDGSSIIGKVRLPKS